MAPTIRIDSDVYRWLQQQAQPFEDTPNSVLRRVAGLDGEAVPQQPTAMHVAREGPTRSPKRADSRRGNSEPKTEESIRGAKLNALWRVGAKHALYRQTGDWYQNLKRFPGALFDPSGYVLFQTEEDYRKCPHVSIAQTTHVAGGIRSIPGYIRVK